jgi:ABC-type molybdate transport system permease subunit
LEPTFRNSVKVSSVYTIAAVGIKLVFGMIAALVLREALPPRNFWRMLLFLPWCVPVVINAYTWRWIYDDLSGVLSQSLLRWGLTDHYIFWLASPSLALKSVIAVEVWQGTPFYMMTFLPGLAAIPTELYEAAAVDGAGALRRFVHVTFPSLMPVIIIVVLLSTIWTVNNMQIVYVLTRGGPNGAFDPIDVRGYVVFKGGKNPTGGVEALRFFMQPANYEKVVTASLNRNAPVFKGLMDRPMWQKPAYRDYKRLMSNAQILAYPGPPNPAQGEVHDTFFIPHLLQAVCTGAENPTQAMNEAYDQMGAIYKKWKQPIA